MRIIAYRTLVQTVASRKFFWFVVALFTLQASWLAISGNYPQAFDEQYHLGSIQLHAQQWSPFFTEQPPGADAHGALVRDPSILYHYLLSFFYRFIALFTDNQVLQIIILRFTSVGLAVWGLLLFRRLLRLVGISPAKTHLAILLISILPVYVLLAAQLNYDNLLIPASTLTIIWAVELYRSYKKHGHLDWLATLRLVIATMLFSTIKYAYLPVALACALLALPLAWKARKTALSASKKAFRALPASAKVGYLAAATSALVFFGGSIGYNVVKYHSPNPSCEKVLTVERCMAFGPFARDYPNIEKGEHASLLRLATFPFQWTNNMLREAVFSVYSYFDSEGVVHYYGGNKLPHLMALVWLWCLICIAVIGASIRQLLRQPDARILLLFSGIYTVAVLYVNLKRFYQVDYIAAVHARYLFPVIIPIIALALMGAGYLAQYLRPRYWPLSKRLGVALVAITLAGFALGGGMLTYILYSGEGSYWTSQQVPLVRAANGALREVLQAVISVR